MHAVIWKCLDRAGHDACRFTESAEGWRIEGAAVFEHAGHVANLAYCLICDQRWASLEATVSGWVGNRNRHFHIERARDGGWRINGMAHPDLTASRDIDLGFTPASNTNAIRRLNLSEGEGADSVAVWLDSEDWTVRLLPQSYRRIRADAYDYASPQHAYRATILVDDFGAVSEYPGLWRMHPQGEA